jgi:SAM-dependent methyltransferase
MKKENIIQDLINKNGFKSYLEIGSGDGHNFNKIKCETKIGIDPIGKGKDIAVMQSDEYFTHNEDKFDLIFIDGLHHSEQVERDILNSWKVLNKGGVILIHDIKPSNEEMTLIPRNSKEWTGDVFKCWHGLKSTKLKLSYIDEQYGLGCIKKSNHKLEIGFTSDISFVDYFDSEGWLIKN